MHRHRGAVVRSSHRRKRWRYRSDAGRKPCTGWRCATCGIMMKTSIFSILAMILSGSLAFAAAPQKTPLTKYSPLWSNSPFTTKPPPKPQGEDPSVLDDWTLGGVSAVEGGYMITLHH